MSISKTNIINKLDEAKNKITDYSYNLLSQLPDFTEVVDKYAGLEGKIAKIATYSLELTTVLSTIRSAHNFQTVATKANALGFVLNTAGLITNTDGLIKGSKELASTGIEYMTDYARSILPEQSVNTAEDIVISIGNSAVGAIEALPTNFAKLVNSGDKLKSAIKTLPKLVGSYNNDLSSSAGIINNIANIIVSNEQKAYKAAGKINLPIDLNSLINEYKNTTANYVVEILPEKVISSTENALNHVYDILNTDYVRTIINAAGLLANYENVYKIGSKLAKKVTVRDVAKLGNTGSKLISSIKGIVHNAKDIINKVTDEDNVSDEGTSSDSTISILTTEVDNSQKNNVATQSSYYFLERIGGLSQEVKCIVAYREIGDLYAYSESIDHNNNEIHELVLVGGMPSLVSANNM